MNTKLHALTDANGRPLSFFITAGQVRSEAVRRARSIPPRPGMARISVLMDSYSVASMLPSAAAATALLTPL